MARDHTFKNDYVQVLCELYVTRRVLNFEGSARVVLLQMALADCGLTLDKYYSETT